MDIKTVATHFDDVKWKSDDSFMARCPCHNDNDPSLKISLNKQNGKTWVNGYCFAGCDLDTIKMSCYCLDIHSSSYESRSGK